MSVTAELNANRRNTRYFIGCHPVQVALTPQVSSRTASGGVLKLPGTPRVVQTMRLIDQSSISGNNPGLNHTPDGAERKATHQLLAEFDAEMAVDDFWLADGGRYVVTEMLPNNGYEVRGAVTFYGK